MKTLNLDLDTNAYCAITFGVGMAGAVAVREWRWEDWWAQAIVAGLIVASLASSCHLLWSVWKARRAERSASEG